MLGEVELFAHQVVPLECGVLAHDHALDAEFAHGRQPELPRELNYTAFL